MKKFLVFTSSSALVLFAFIVWSHYPWQFLIIKKINTLGENNITDTFDNWIDSRPKSTVEWEEISLNNLPELLRVKGIKKAILKKEGLYLLYRKLFVESNYILIRSKFPFPSSKTSTDPKFIELKKRIWIVEIKG